MIRDELNNMEQEEEQLV